MLTVLVVLGVIAAASAFGASRFGRIPHRMDEVDRFHQARRITTGWAEAGITRPLVADLEPSSEERSREVQHV